MYEITVEQTFAASHALRLPDGDLEPIHGHNWRVKVTVACENDALDAIESVMDFHELQSMLDEAVEPFHNRHLNDCEPFGPPRGSAVSAGRGEPTRLYNSTAERVARVVAERINPLPDHVRLTAVAVSEAPGCVATYRP